MNTTVAITGATGHIGAVLMPMLISKGYRIRALVYNEHPAFESPKMETIRGSLKAQKELGYSCRPFRVTVADTINWFKQAGKLQ